MPTRRMLIPRRRDPKQRVVPLTHAAFARFLGQHVPEAELACCADTRRLYGPHAACTTCGNQPSGH